MLVRLLIGGVTLAAAGYAVKEYCEEEGCPWDLLENDSFSNSNDELVATQEKVNYTKSAEFHKRKKKLYKSSMREYKEFLNLYSIENDTVEKNAKIVKQKFVDEVVDELVESYMDKIIKNMEILSYSLSIGIKYITSQTEQPTDEDLAQLQAYTKSISNLANVVFFIDRFSGESLIRVTHYNAVNRIKINKEQILSTLVEAMSLSVEKGNLYVDLSVV